MSNMCKISVCYIFYICYFQRRAEIGDQGEGLPLGTKNTPEGLHQKRIVWLLYIILTKE